MLHSALRGLRPLLVAACALALGASMAAAQQQPEVRALRDGYVPDTLVVPAGTIVRFVNTDSDIHTVTHRGGQFDSGLLFMNDSWTYRFSDPGTYEYFCIPHPWLAGSIVVE